MIHSPVTEIKDAAEATRAGNRTSYRGELWGTPAVSVASRLGKVAVATTATRLIAQLGVDRIVFTGVAEGIARALADPAVPRRRPGLRPAVRGQFGSAGLSDRFRPDDMAVAGQADARKNPRKYRKSLQETSGPPSEHSR